jgi:hypothetical protein
MKICLYPIPITGLSTRKPKKRNAMQLPHINAVEAAALGILAKTTFDAAVAALPKPTKQSGFYIWLHDFLSNERSAVDGYLDARFHLAQPSGSLTVPASLTVTDPDPKGK